MNDEIHESKRNTLEKLSYKTVTALFTDNTGEPKMVAVGKFMLEPMIQITGLPDIGDYIHFIDGQISEVHLDSIFGVYPYQGYHGGQIVINEPLMKALQRKENGRT